MDVMDIPLILDTLRPGAAWAMLGPTDSYAALDWRDAAQSKPTEAEVTAAWPAARAALEAAATEAAAAKLDGQAVRDQAAAMYQACQQVVDGIDAANTAQTKAAIKALAQNQQKLIRGLAGVIRGAL